MTCAFWNGRKYVVRTPAGVLDHDRTCSGGATPRAATTGKGSDPWRDQIQVFFNESSTSRIANAEPLKIHRSASLSRGLTSTAQEIPSLPLFPSVEICIFALRITFATPLQTSFFAQLARFNGCELRDFSPYRSEFSLFLCVEVFAFCLRWHSLAYASG